MKKVFLIYFCLMAIQITFSKSLIAQENVQAKQMIVGKWKFYKSQAADKDKQESVDALLTELIEYSSYTEYKADGTWESKFKTKYLDQITKGVWKLDTEGKSLVSILPSGEEVTTYILELTDHKLVKKNMDGGINTYIK